LKTLVFEVFGEPAPKGSRTVGRRKNGTIYTRPANPKEKSWAKAVSDACRGHVGFDGPYEVELKFRFVSPGKPSYSYPSRSDLDKLVRCTLDGLVVGQVLTDDRHVTRLVAQKEYGTEGCIIKVRSLSD